MVQESFGGLGVASSTSLSSGDSSLILGGKLAGLGAETFSDFINNLKMFGIQNFDFLVSSINSLQFIFATGSSISGLL